MNNVSSSVGNVLAVEDACTEAAVLRQRITIRQGAQLSRYFSRTALSRLRHLGFPFLTVSPSRFLRPTRDGCAMPRQKGLDPGDRCES